MYQFYITLRFFFLIPAITIIPSVVFFVIFLKDHIKTGQRMFLYLAFLFLTYLISNFFALGSIMNQTVTINEQGAVFSFTLFSIFNMLMFYVLILVLEMFDKNVLFSGSTVLLSSLLLIVIGGLITFSQVEVIPTPSGLSVQYSHLSLIVIIQWIFYGLSTLIILLKLFRGLRSARSPKQKTLIKWLALGILLSMFIPLDVDLAMHSLSDAIENIRIIGDFIINTLQNIGMLVIGIAFYAVSKTPWLLQRQKIHMVSVFSNAGVEIYSKSFREDLSSSDLLLLAGGFSAITSLFQEATKAKGSVKAILLEDTELRVINRDYFLCALLVEYTTQASVEAQKRFVNEFEKKFEQDLAEFQGEITKFKQADEIIQSFFS